MDDFKMKNLILFDLDGVLIDSQSNMEYAWNAVQEAVSISTPFNDYFELIGRPFHEILELLGLTSMAHEIEKIFNSTSLSGLSLIKFYPDIVDTLTYLHHKGIKLGVVTSKDSMRTNKILNELPFDFDVIQTPNSKYRGKPSPDHLLISMATTGVDPRNTIYIGDMQVDLEAAYRAKIDYLHAGWGYQEVSQEDAIVVSSIKDVINYL
jgi:phosphoglycolate phosphatase